MNIYDAIAEVDSQSIARGAEILKRGGLVAFPTETVYGLGADARNEAAVAGIFAAKARPAFNPLIVHVPDFEMARDYGVFPDRAQRLAKAFWPGALTLVVRKTADCALSRLVSAGLDTVALRVPADAAAQSLLRAFGGPVAAPSANPSGRISPTEAEHVAEGLGGKVELILDGGACEVGMESAIVGFGDETAVLLRPGGISRQQIEDVLGGKLADHEPGKGVSAPGQTRSHYAPRAALRLNARTPREGEMWLGFGPGGPQNIPGLNLSPAGDLQEAAANLFAYLHMLDDTGAGKIAVMPIPHTGLGEAINDRLQRAAADRDA
jgi:L-threonylcarbamoyladenylate synthase